MKTRVIDWTKVEGPLDITQRFNYCGHAFEWESRVYRGALSRGVLVAIMDDNLGCHRVELYRLVVARKNLLENMENIPKGARGFVIGIRDPWERNDLRYIRVWFEGQTGPVDVELSELDILKP